MAPSEVNLLYIAPDHRPVMQQFVDHLRNGEKANHKLYILYGPGNTGKSTFVHQNIEQFTPYYIPSNFTLQDIMSVPADTRLVVISQDASVMNQRRVALLKELASRFNVLIVTLDETQYKYLGDRAVYISFTGYPLE